MEMFQKDSEEVVNVVSDYFNLDSERVLSKEMTSLVVKARRIIIYILHKDYGYNSSLIAKLFNGGKRRVFVACELIREFMKIYEDYRTDYNEVTRLLNK